MKQESVKKIISITSAPGWQAVFADTDKSGAIKPIIVPAGYFAAVREIILEKGARYHHQRVEEDQDVEDISEYVELHIEEDGGFGDPTSTCNFIKFLGPGQNWTAEDQAEMEDGALKRAQLRLVKRRQRLT